MKLVVEARGSVLQLRPLGYDDRVKVAIYRHVPSARWNKARRCWEAPNTAGTYSRIAESLSHLAALGIEVSGAKQPPSSRPADRFDDLPFTSAARRHQVASYWYLDWARKNLGAALLDCGMRTGKTMMVLNHLCGLPKKDQRALVVAPKKAVAVWEGQAELWLPKRTLRVVAIEDGSVAVRVSRAVALLSSGEPVVVILSWSVLERLTLEQRKTLRKALVGATVVGDEVHRAKGAGSARSQALAMISRDSAFRIGPSGTPLSHSPLDAYGVFRFLDPGIWGMSYSRFRDTYALMGGFNNHQVLGFRSLEDLARRMSPYTFKASRDVLDLPPAQHINIPLKLPPAARAVYDEMEREAVVELRSGSLIASNRLAQLMRLAQIASGHLPAIDGSADEIVHEEKRAALQELLEDCDPTEPWVVFGRFHHDLDSARLAAEGAERRCFELSGRRDELKEWRAGCKRGEGVVLAVQIASGGEGIALDEAAFVAYMSVGYSLSDFDQSKARPHGPDQKRSVAYYHLICKGTVDVDIRRALDKRANVLEYVSQCLLEARQEEVA